MYKNVVTQYHNHCTCTTNKLNISEQRDAAGSEGLVAADLVDLVLQVDDNLRGHLVSEDLLQVDPLVARDRLIGCQLNAFLDLDEEIKG
jgi:hypothetical protein